MRTRGTQDPLGSISRYPSTTGTRRYPGCTYQRRLTKRRRPTGVQGPNEEMGGDKRENWGTSHAKTGCNGAGDPQISVWKLGTYCTVLWCREAGTDLHV